MAAKQEILHPEPRRQKTGGRQTGTPNRITQRNVTKAVNAGPMPFDVLLHAMHVHLAEHNRLTNEAKEQGKIGLTPEAKEALNLASECATRAAPYCTPRLHAIGFADFKDMRRAQADEQNSQGDDAIDVTDYSKLSSAELLALTRRKIAES